ncbi:hypothetical protein CEXT_580431 [Caerostris extrusa]|uniref:Uncharacterized protein n=1 Tax=Caerostris extrusa TaxID=172846 RepID=A0AAV4PL01_CAEEX|nr:hypothetical protein CEXT_580431 [Caerostris extrusa]
MKESGIGNELEAKCNVDACILVQIILSCLGCSDGGARGRSQPPPTCRRSLLTLRPISTCAFTLLTSRPTKISVPYNKPKFVELCVAESVAGSPGGVQV